MTIYTFICFAILTFTVTWECFLSYKTHVDCNRDIARLNKELDTANFRIAELMLKLEKKPAKKSTAKPLTLINDEN